jgi:hypothetical protein
MTTVLGDAVPTARALGALGAPGVRLLPPEPVRELTGVRRDAAAFLGVAPRGPAWLPAEPLEPDVDVADWLTTTRRRRCVPVPVGSWEEYRRQFGGFEGPGRLPYAVSTFFAGGGRRAVVVRVVHEHPDRFADAEGRASGALVAGDAAVTTTTGTPVELFARSEGSWGNRVSVTVRWTTRPLACDVVDAATLVVSPRTWVPGGTLLRLAVGGTTQLRLVDTSLLEDDPAGPGRRRVLRLATPASAPPVQVEVVSGDVVVVDHDPTLTRRELLSGVGVRADHPRWLARVLATESALVWPHASWASGTLALDDPALPTWTLAGGSPATGTSTAAAMTPPTMAGGVDRWDTIVPEDFTDAEWVPGDEQPGDGVQCLAEVDDVGLVLAPDLVEPEPLVPPQTVPDAPTLCGPDFAVHVGPLAPPPPAAPPAPRLTGLALDARDALDRARIVANQQALVAFADVLRAHTVLLDVPLGLSHRQVLAWRDAFDSPYAAAYHPWLDVTAAADPAAPQAVGLVRLNPSAFAAAIIADRELRLGVQHGPANAPAVGAVRVADQVPPAQHDELHLAGVNVFQADRDGVRLTGARTLSRRVELRQLNVARLLTVLRLTLERELDWAVFEPSNAELWAQVRRLVHALLRRLFEAGAFAGATPAEAFFVRCDRSTMTRLDLDQGRLVCLVGVAPAEPVEYLLLQVALASVGQVRVEVVG